MCIKDVCVVYRASGGACEDAHPCIPTLACFGGKCATSGSLGDTCDPAGATSPTCDPYQGLWCDGASGKCKTFLFAPTGGACGTTGADYARCSGGGSCIKGSCVGTALDDAACSSADGPPCKLFAKCVTGSCRFPDAKPCK